MPWPEVQNRPSAALSGQDSIFACRALAGQVQNSSSNMAVLAMTGGIESHVVSIATVQGLVLARKPSAVDEVPQQRFARQPPCMTPGAPSRAADSIHSSGQGTSPAAVLQMAGQQQPYLSRQPQQEGAWPAQAAASNNAGHGERQTRSIMAEPSAAAHLGHQSAGALDLQSLGDEQQDLAIGGEAPPQGGARVRLQQCTARVDGNTELVSRAPTAACCHPLQHA